MEAAAQRDEAGNDKFFEEFEILGSCGTKEEDIYGGMYEMPGQGFRTVPPPPPQARLGPVGPGLHVGKLVSVVLVWLCIGIGLLGLGHCLGWLGS